MKLLTLLSLLALASPAGAAEAMQFQAMIGNHDGIVLTVDRLDAPTIVALRRWGQSAQTYYQLDTRGGEIHVTMRREDRAGFIDKTVEPSDPDYRTTLTTMRDMTAHVSAPDRYTWGDVYDQKILAPELAPLITAFDHQLAAHGGAAANCVIASDDGLEAPSALKVTVGLRADLGPVAHTARTVWVRAGYQAVLFREPGFGKKSGFRIVKGASTTSDQLTDLRGSDYAGKVASLMCLRQVSAL